MAKKLKVELDLDTTKAKQKAKEVVETGGDAATGGGGAVSTSAEKTADALEKASRGAKDFGDRAEAASSEMGRLGKVFAGMGIGLAQSLMANGGTGGFAGQAAVGAVSAGMMGYSAAGKKGAAAAALASLGVSYFESEQNKLAEQEAKAKQLSANLDSIKDWEEARKRTLEFKATLESLTNVEDDLADRQQRLAEEIKKREDADKELQRQLIRESGEDGIEFQRIQSKRNANAAEIDALNAAMKSIEKEGKSKSSNGGGMSWSGIDTLSSIGGAFAGSGAGGRSLANIEACTAETVKVLEKIERNTQGGNTWQ